MSWRSEAKPLAAVEDEKTFMKTAKKLREILKLESFRGPLESNQKEKIKQKDLLIKEITSLHITWDFWQDKGADIYDILSIEQRKPIESKKNQLEKREKERREIEERRKIEERKNNDRADSKGLLRVDQPKRAELKWANRHERPVTDLCFSRESGSLYSSSKSETIIRWNVYGDLLKPDTSLCGHLGAVYSLDIYKNMLISGGTDEQLCLWENNRPNTKTSGGRNSKEQYERPIHIHSYPGAIKGIRAHSEHGLVIFTHKYIKEQAHLAVIDVSDDGTQLQRRWKMEDPQTLGAKINCVIWGRVGKPKIFAGHDDGSISVWGWDSENSAGNFLTKIQPHTGSILSFNTIPDAPQFLLTASVDQSCKALVWSSPQIPTAFVGKANRPIRAVGGWDFPEEKCFAFVYGGGADAREVTTRKNSNEEFEFQLSYFGSNINPNDATQLSHAAHQGPIHRMLWVEISKNEKRIFTAGEEGDVKMWSDETLRQYR